MLLILFLWRANVRSVGGYPVHFLGGSWRLPWHRSPSLLASTGDFAAWATPASLAKSSAATFRLVSILTTVTP